MASKQIPLAFDKGFFKTFNTFTKDPLFFLRNYATNETGISQFRIFQYRIIHLSHPDFIKHILEDKTGKYTQSRDRDHMKLLFGDGLLTSTGEHWKKQRAMIQPSLGRAEIGKLAEKIHKQTIDFTLPIGDETDLHEYSLKLVNKIMADILFSNVGKEILEIGDLLMEMKGETLKRLSDFALPLWIPTSRNIRYKKRRALVYEKILEQVTLRKNQSDKPMDLLTSFIEATDKNTGKGMSDEELVEELLGVYAAAHEPVAIALTYALFLIARHPEIKTELDNELKTLFNKEFNPGNYSSLVYTKNIVQETLRLYPPVWVSGKRALQNDTINGFEIKKNDNFIYSPVILHSHPDFWENPEQFHPNRFLNSTPRHPFVYIPFSGGAKFCAGSHLALMILQMTIADIHLNFNIHTHTEEVNINPFTTLKPVNRILAKVTEK